MAPYPHFDQKQNQQAVVWLAQDVYEAHYERLQDGKDHLRMVKLWRDLIVFLNDWPGHTKMQELLVEAWGRNGPQMVGEMGHENWKLFLRVGSE